MTLYRPDQSIAALTINKINANPEVTRITCLADAGVFEVQSLTFVAFASMAQGDYVVLQNKAGTKFAIWFDKDNNGTAPTGAAYVASDVQIEVNITTGDTAAQVTTKAYDAIVAAGTLVDLTISQFSSTVLYFTATKLGNVVAPDPHNSNDSGVGSITTATVTGGVASSLQNKYFVMRNPAGTVYNAWFNINGEGIDPNPTGTEIECACDGGASASSMASSIATAINANSNFKSWAQDGYLYVANEATGNATDVSAGDSGFTILKIQDGSAGYENVDQNAGSININPSAIS